MPDKNQHPASFRDPNGFLFTHQNRLYRQVNQLYKPNYDHLMESGLYEDLVTKGWLIPHDECDLENFRGDLAYKFIQPKVLNPERYDDSQAK